MYLKCLIIHEVKCIGYHPLTYFKVSALSAHKFNNLEQLFFESQCALVSDEFMEMVSAHSKLAHAVLQISTITENAWY